MYFPHHFLSSPDPISVITSLATVGAVAIAIWQTVLSRKALDAAKKSVDDATRTRQLELLPKFSWIIQVDVELKHWQEELQEKVIKLRECVATKNESILDELEATRIRSPQDLRLSRYMYEKMPDWLTQIWLSGAQYYYSAVASVPYLRDSKGEPSFSLAETLIDVCEESKWSISELRAYLKDSVPPVILDTPASVNSGEFLEPKS